MIGFLFLSHCSREVKQPCIKSTITTTTLFYITATEEDCKYYLYSTYFGEKNAHCGMLWVVGDKVLVKLSPLKNHYEELFSFQANPSTKNEISIWHRNWEEKRGDHFVTKKYDVILDSILYRGMEKIAVIKIRELIHIAPETGPLNAVVFFSSSLGFIGSYYTSDKTPLEIIESRGDILKGQLDYSRHSFVKIM